MTLVYQIIYVSTPDKNLKVSEVERIVKKARSKNETKSITGFLCANSNFFIQCIEGDQEDVEALFEIIRQDDRHSRIETVRSGTYPERTFKQWGMGVVLGMEKHFDIIKRYSDGDNFDPYQLSYDDSLNLLIDFSKVRGA